MYKYDEEKDMAYPYALRKAYQKTGVWPNSGLDIGDDEFTKYFASIPEGQKRVVVNGKLAFAPVVTDETLERELLSIQIRRERDALIERVTNEINRIEDAAGDSQPWRNYRISLRNLPQAAGFPESVKWPEPPGEFTGK